MYLLTLRKSGCRTMGGSSRPRPTPGCGRVVASWPNWSRRGLAAGSAFGGMSLPWSCNYQQGTIISLAEERMAETEVIDWSVFNWNSCISILQFPFQHLVEFGLLFLCVESINTNKTKNRVSLRTSSEFDSVSVPTQSIFA